jgi:hypothetical protein
MYSSRPFGIDANVGVSKFPLTFGFDGTTINLLLAIVDVFDRERYLTSDGLRRGRAFRSWSGRPIVGCESSSALAGVASWEAAPGRCPVTECRSWECACSACYGGLSAGPVRGAGDGSQCSQASEGVWGMPGHTEARKAAVSCDKPGGAAHTRRSPGGRMGEPVGAQAPSSPKGEANPGN